MHLANKSESYLVATYDKQHKAIFSTPTLKSKAPQWKNIQFFLRIENTSSEVKQRKFRYRQQPGKYIQIFRFIKHEIQVNLHTKTYHLFFTILQNCGYKGISLVQYKATAHISLVFASAFSGNETWPLNSDCTLSHKQNFVVKCHY